MGESYLSASRIKLYNMCGMKYEFKYEKQIKMPSNYAVNFGSAVHKGFEYYYKEKIKGCTTKANIVLDYALTELEKLTKVSTVDAQTMTYVVPPYIDNVAVNIKPIEVEKEIKYKTATGVDMLGYIDLVTPDAICDYKVTDKKWDLARVQGDLQFVVYAAATGINNVSIHNITKSNGAKSKTETKENVTDIGNIRLLNWTYTEKDYRHLEVMIHRVATAIKAGIFVPCDPAAWCCNEKWCEYWAICRGG